MKTIQFKFVEYIPSELEECVLYISIEYKTAVHKCICGCGNKVVTPITPTDWKLIFDGKTVSLSPSIGSWNLKCKSHYFITKNKIYHAGGWDDWKKDENKQDASKQKISKKKKVSILKQMYKRLSKKS
jgi:hypothetical protein